jgi:hypothetical membrane protein
MELNPLKWPMTCIAGITMIIAFFIFIPISVALFPNMNLLIYIAPPRIIYFGPYNIVKNYLSDLGNYFFNPIGANFFNIGLVLIGLLLFPFFYGIYQFWEDTPHKNLLKLCRIIGFASAIALIMIGVFSENSPFPLHELWSMIFFALILIVMGISGYAILDDDNFMKFSSYYAFGAIFFNIFFMATGSPFLEWITVLTALAYAGLLIIDILKMQ